MEEQLTSVLSNIEATKEAYPELSDILQKIIALFIHLEGGLLGSTINYQNVVIGSLKNYPISLGRSNSLYHNYGGSMDLEEAKKELNGYLASLESLKYLSFLREEKKNVVFVGSNGSGKTTLIKHLQTKLNNDEILFFPADRMLSYDSDMRNPRQHEKLISEINNSYKHAINGSVYESAKLFTQYIDLLKDERFYELNNTSNGNAKKIIDKWNDLIKTRELFFERDLWTKPKNGSNNNKYDIRYLSSGEKSILFFMMSVLLNNEKAYYFVDEPENNLNPSIVSELWDFLEQERPNSIFVYLTHDNTFAISRYNSKEYWIKEFDGNAWDYEEISLDDSDLPKELIVELLGTRKPILFCESENKTKKDYRFFRLVFPDYKIIPSGGCDKVISNVKAYVKLKPQEVAIGIIDRDYKDESYLTGLSNNSVYPIPFFEIENMVACKIIMKPLLTSLFGDLAESKEESIKNLLRNRFVSSKDVWIVRHVAFELRDKFDYRGKIKRLNNLNDFKNMYESERLNDDQINALAANYESIFNNIVSTDEYDLYLKYLDYKNVLNDIQSALGITDDKDLFTIVLDFLSSEEGSPTISTIRSNFFNF